MTIIDSSTHPGSEERVETACGARIKLTHNTSFVYHRDEIVYFCGEDCKQLYDEDPLNSCMAARIISGE